MINGSNGVIIDGVSIPYSHAVYAMGDDGEPYKPLGLLVADGAGGAVSASVSTVLKIDGAVAYVLCAPLYIAAGWEYNISGAVIPVGSTIYLVNTVFEKAADVTSELVADVQTSYKRRTRSDKTDGYFQINGVTSDVGGVTLFAIIPAAELSAEALGFSLTAETAVERCVGDDGGSSHSRLFTALLDPYGIPNDSGASPTLQDWTFVFDGTAPAGAVVNISFGALDDLDSLLEYLIVSTTAEDDGSWHIEVSGRPRLAHTAWIYAESAPGFAGQITSVEKTDYVCLSGDTLVTMADGTPRRLDALKVGELVRAGDGTPTAITRLERGRFYPEHQIYRFSDGRLIDAPHDHRFFNREQGFFQYLSRWQIGEHATREDGTETALEGVTTIHECAELFGIWTESHDYWANGLLSGETAANQRFIPIATAEMAAEMAASLTVDATLRLLGLEDFYP